MGGYDYLYVHSVDEYFKSHYGVLFDGSISTGDLYEVVKEKDGRLAFKLVG